MNGLKYWDPEESTRTKLETTYASELQDRGLTQDFTGLSELLLGQAQPKQFQSADQTGYWWGSKVSDDGNFTALDAVENNANAEMPRTYNGRDRFYYNWFATTAESGTYNMTSEIAGDSICPAGWQLPSGAGSATDKTWANLVTTTYGLSDGSGDSTAALAKKPFYLEYAGAYVANSGAASYWRGRLYYWSSLASSESAAHSFHAAGENLKPQNRNLKSTGYLVRCAKK